MTSRDVVKLYPQPTSLDRGALLRCIEECRVAAEVLAAMLIRDRAAARTRPGPIARYGDPVTPHVGRLPDESRVA